MIFSEQLQIAFYRAPISLAKMRLQSFKWAAIYFFSGIIIFGFFFYWLIQNQDSIKSVLLDYLFPASWHDISIRLADFLFESQAKTVLGNLIISGSMVLSSMFLFPIKEKYSSVFEEEASFNNGGIKEFPLAYQAWEEVKLFVLYLTAQSVILWIGYYPYAWTTWMSIILSYLFLFFTFGLDLISPTLQRHRTKYSLILKLLSKKWALPLTFGMLFSLPMIFLSRWIFKQENYSLIEISCILFLVNILLLTVAVPVGTYIASKLLKQRYLIVAPTRKSMRIGYSTMFILLIVTLLLHSQLIASLHHKSQLLKANYDIDWSSIEYELPTFSQLTKGDAFSNLSFYMEMSNPTDFDIMVEKSKLIFEQKENTIAVVDLNGFSLESRGSKRIKIEFNSNSNLSKVSQLNELLEDWRVEMHLQVWPGIPLVLNLLESNVKSSKE